MSKHMKEGMPLWKWSQSQQIKNKAFRRRFSVCPKPSLVRWQGGVSGLDSGLCFVVLLHGIVSPVYQLFGYPRKQSPALTMVLTEVKRVRLWSTGSQPSPRAWQNRLKEITGEKNILGFEIDFKSRASSPA